MKRKTSPVQIATAIGVGKGSAYEQVVNILRAANIQGANRFTFLYRRGEKWVFSCDGLREKVVLYIADDMRKHLSILKKGHIILA